MTSTGYAGDRRPVEEVDGRGDITGTVYDAAGNAWETIDALGNKS